MDHGFGVCVCAHAVSQLRPTLCSCMDCSPPGSSAHGIFQARILVWSVLPFPSPGVLPHPGIEPVSRALVGGFFTTEPPGKPPGVWYHS